jgi:hypothetical protein
MLREIGGYQAVTMKNDVFWNVAPCGSLRADVSEERIVSIIRVTRIDELGTTLAIISNPNISSLRTSVASYC